MNRCQPKNVTYQARCYYRKYGKVTWYLARDRVAWWRSWHWTKDPNRQATFSDYGALVNAIDEAGSPDRDNKSSAPGGWVGTRQVIIETITHEETELGPYDHLHWKQEQRSA